MGGVIQPIEIRLHLAYSTNTSMSESTPENNPKTPHAEREERILSFWKEQGIFDKSLEKNKNSGKEFTFYEGPPTANGHPGIHHLEARAFKDAIPRYKTMQGYFVKRRGGWDTHGLPVELQVEKQLGFKSKKEIDTYGIAAFNEKCKDSVWAYVHEWEDFTNRMGYWVDLKDPYITYKPNYIESLWNIVKTVDSQDLLYKDYKVVPWCPRCGTGLSSHELAQGYKDVKDLSVYVKFRSVKEKDVYFLAWTTTPWTLPGNVGLAVSSKIEYVKIKQGAEFIILAKERLSVVKEAYEIVSTMKGSELLGEEYEPLFPFMNELVTDKTNKARFANAYKILDADFVTTTDGTGIVHTAVMYGQEDFELGTKSDLPKIHLVDESGHFINGTGYFEGKFVKEEETDVAIIKDLAQRGLLFGKEKYAHSYPFCWRCHTPLIYYARDSWYIRMSSLRAELVEENQKINWEPSHIKNGRFGEWLSEVKDWAISRERYWGTPLPVWVCSKCNNKKVIGSIAEIAKPSKNEYWVMRHGEADHNVSGVLNSDIKKVVHLTEKGRNQVNEAVEAVKQNNIDLIIVSPFMRTAETAEIIREKLGLSSEQVITDSRLHELGTGEWEGRGIADFIKEFPFETRFERTAPGGELYAEVKKRVGEVLYDIESKYEGKKILFITHGAPAIMLLSAALGLHRKESIALEGKAYINNAEVRKIDFKILPHNSEFELDLHRPYVDDVTLSCDCGGVMSRVKEVMDVWFDSGAMPFAQSHYPFNSEKENSNLAYPADFISEAIDQTRGWFYTLHAIGILMGKGRAYNNVICLGHILDSQGKKMSKSIGNVIDPWSTMDKFGADALRYWVYTVNQPGESKNFDEKTVDEVIKKVFNLITNVLAFYKTYSGDTKDSGEVYKQSDNVLDLWIVSRLNQLTTIVTTSLDAYKFLEPTRAIRDFVGDLSQWYLRRSRDRFKEDGTGKDQALSTLKFVLIELSKLMAPFTPFFAEDLYKSISHHVESVHLESWPQSSEFDADLISKMETVRFLASKGLEARMAAKINVRQPLASLRIKAAHDLSSELVSIIKDEVNVKEVVFGVAIESEVELDTVLTPELKEEGEVRELVRKIQDMRKEKGLSVGDLAVLVATEDMKAIISKNEASLKKVTNLSGIEFGTNFELKA